MKHTILDYIGYQSYIYFYFITFIATILYRQDLLWFVILVSVINWNLNTALKLIFKQPRPKNIIAFNGHKPKFYGMPSGHAQTATFNSFILAYITQSKYVVAFSVFICATVFYHRLKYNAHTQLQVFFGALVGLLYGYASITWLHPLVNQIFSI